MSERETIKKRISAFLLIFFWDLRSEKRGFRSKARLPG